MSKKDNQSISITKKYKEAEEFGLDSAGEEEQGQSVRLVKQRLRATLNEAGPLGAQLSAGLREGLK